MMDKQLFIRACSKKQEELSKRIEDQYALRQREDQEKLIKKLNETHN